MNADHADWKDLFVKTAFSLARIGNRATKTKISPLIHTDDTDQNCGRLWPRLRLRLLRSSAFQRFQRPAQCGFLG